MSFIVESKKEETSLKSIRLPNELVIRINDISRKNNITFSRFIIQAIKYALDNLEDKPGNKK